MNHKLKAGNSLLAILVGMGIVLAVALVMLGYAYQPGSPAQPQPEPNQQTYGGMPGNLIPGNCYVSNGVTTCSKGGAFTQATTTVCAIQAPAATSTMIDGGANFSISSTSASFVTIAKATTQYATTTILATSTVSANAQGYSDAMATSSNPSGVTATPLSISTANQLVLTDRTFAPNTWMVVGMAPTAAQSGGGATFSPVGYCHATFRVIATDRIN